MERARTNKANFEICTSAQWVRVRPSTKSSGYQVFETVDYLTFHLPWGLEVFTESVFMYDICCLKIIERDLKICVLGT